MAGGKARQATRPPVVPIAPVVLVVDGEPIACPASIVGGDADIWAELAPLAHRSGKLTADMVPAFALLCAQAAAERLMRVDLEKSWGPDHRGLIRLVELGMARFRIQPDGKQPAVVEVAKDEWTEFDAPLALVKR